MRPGRSLRSNFRFLLSRLCAVKQEEKRPKRRLEVKGRWPRGLTWLPWLPAGAAGQRPLLREPGPARPAEVPAAAPGGGGSARPTLHQRWSRFHKLLEQPLGPFSTGKRNSISVLIDTPAPMAPCPRVPFSSRWLYSGCGCRLLKFGKSYSVGKRRKLCRLLGSTSL